MIMIELFNWSFQKQNIFVRIRLHLLLSRDKSEWADERISVWEMGGGWKNNYASHSAFLALGGYSPGRRKIKRQLLY